MDYEKKYKEALELARVAAFNGHQSLMEGIFPELAESEDEKTRKRIIALVNAHGQGMYKDDMLAWLEKQKPIQNINKEDEEVRQYIVRTMEQKDINVPMVQKALAWLENIPYTIDHEKREGFHLGYKAALEKQGETSPILSNSSNIGKDEQKSAWSEEDESILQGIWDEILANKHDAEEYEWKTYDKFLNWLKSLKQRNTWKPSNEQILALDSTLQYSQVSHNSYENLNSLYNDLKKLTE